MQKNIPNGQLEKKRKFLLMLPVLVLPFVVIIFFALGGGRKTNKHESAAVPGLNMELPGAHFKKGRQPGKLGAYEIAERDSLKIKEAIRNDPYYLKDSLAAVQHVFEHASSFSTTLTGARDVDSNEKKLEEKIALLKNAITQKSEPPVKNYPAPMASHDNPDLGRIERMIKNANAQGRVDDPEMDRIEKVLDKIIAVQNPASPSRDTPAVRDVKPVAPVQKKLSAEKIVFLDRDTTEEIALNAFFNLPDLAGKEEPVSNTIEAVIEESQTLVPGAVVKLRLLNEITIRETRIPKGESVYATTSLSNERLTVTVSTIRSVNNIFPVSLDVYDMDGLRGIFVPGSITRDAGTQSAGQAISSIGPAVFDPSIGAQAASAGIQAAKALASKKVKLVRVTIPAGYKVLLKDNSQK